MRPGFNEVKFSMTMDRYCNLKILRAIEIFIGVLIVGLYLSGSYDDANLRMPLFMCFYLFFFFVILSFLAWRYCKRNTQFMAALQAFMGLTFIILEVSYICLKDLLYQEPGSAFLYFIIVTLNVLVFVEIMLSIKFYYGDHLPNSNDDVAEHMIFVEGGLHIGNIPESLTSSEVQSIAIDNLFSKLSKNVAKLSKNVAKSKELTPLLPRGNYGGSATHTSKQESENAAGTSASTLKKRFNSASLFHMEMVADSEANTPVPPITNSPSIGADFLGDTSSSSDIEIG